MTTGTKKKKKSLGPNDSGSPSLYSAGTPRRPLQHTVSDQSDRDVITILQQDDQELAEAKLRANQDSELAHTANPIARVLLETAPLAKTKRMSGSSQHSETPTLSSKPKDPHSPKQKIGFFPNKEKIRQYADRNQALAVNVALHESERDTISVMDAMLVLQDEKVEEEEESGGSTFFVNQTILLEEESPDHQVEGQSGTRGGSLVDPVEGSQPGAFRMEPSFHRESPVLWDESSGSSSSSSRWQDEDDEALGGGGQAPVDELSLAPSQEAQQQQSRGGSERPEGTPRRTHEGEILVEATLVTADPEDPETATTPNETVVIPEPELVTAERMSDTYQQDKDRRWLPWAIVGLTLSILFITAAIVTGIVVRDNHRRDQPTEAPTMAPTLFFEDVLPEATQVAVNTTGTPQALAYQWYLRDQEYIGNATTDLQGMLPPPFQSYVPVERFALATLYYAMGGNDGDWKRSTDWLEHSLSACSWYTTFLGSICSAGPQSRRRNLRRRGLQAVTRNYYNRLSLFQNNLTGSFPPEIALLSNLDVFNLHQNAIGGTIPTEFGTFQYLTLFQVFQNLLTGTIPSELGLLPRIRQLNLAFNELTGTIPTELGQLSSSLLSLSASNNPIHGVLPTELGLLARLDSMFFYNNFNLTGPIPSQLGQLTAMTKLQLNAANWTGTLPSEVGLLNKLQVLYLNDNWNLNGSIPESWGNLTNLVQLQLHNTDLTGVVPPGLCKLVDDGTLISLSVNCDQVLCTCFCNCYQYATFVPTLDELLTEPPTVNSVPGGPGCHSTPSDWNGTNASEPFPCDEFFSDVTGNETTPCYGPNGCDPAYYQPGVVSQPVEWPEEPPPLQVEVGHVNLEYTGPTGGELVVTDLKPPLPPEFINETELEARSIPSNIFNH